MRLGVRVREFAALVPDVHAYGDAEKEEKSEGDADSDAEFC